MIAIGKSVGKGGINVMNDVALIQYLINANLNRLTPLKPLAIDGKSGPATAEAIAHARDRVERVCHMHASRVEPGAPLISALAPALRVGAPPNMTARFEELRYRGRARQMAIGRITINQSKTYVFISGGFGRGHLPAGKYGVDKHSDSRSETGFSSDGVGYTFALSDAADSRVGGAARQLLRIHPDGGKTGTKGCIGILGAAATQRAFKIDMNAELDRAGGTVELTVQGMAAG